MGENKLTVMVYSVLGLRPLAVQDLATPLYTTYNVIKEKKRIKSGRHWVSKYYLQVYDFILKMKTIEQWMLKKLRAIWNDLSKDRNLKVMKDTGKHA